MNRERFFEALGEIDERYVAEAYRYAPGDASGASERIVHMNKKRVITFLIAAVLMLTLSVTAYAGYTAVATPKAAERVAREQIEVWKEMGILSPEVNFEGDADAVFEFEERDGGDAWFGRIFPHWFDVRFYGSSQFNTDRPKYGGTLRVDTLNGKIMSATIDAAADEDDVPVREYEIGDIPEANGQPIWYFYDNFDDIFPADMTVDRFCGLLAEYWGFTGYTIADTEDEYFYHQHFDAIDGSTLLKDLCGDTGANYYLTVYFEGDQEGAPMYIQLQQFPGYVTLMLGTNHAVG